MSQSTDPVFKQVGTYLQVDDKAAAREILQKYLKQNPRSIVAWCWLSRSVETRAERLFCLQQAARLQPENKAIRQYIEQMRLRQTPAPLAIHKAIPVTSAAGNATPMTQQMPFARLPPVIPAGNGWRKNSLWAACFLLVGMILIGYFLFFQGTPQVQANILDTGGTAGDSDPVHQVESVRVDQVFQMLEDGMLIGSSNFFSELIAEKVYIRDRWYSREKALAMIATAWEYQRPNRCLSSFYGERDGSQLYQDKTILRLTIYLDNGQSFSMTDGFTADGKLQLTEYDLGQEDTEFSGENSLP